MTDLCLSVAELYQTDSRTSRRALTQTDKQVGEYAVKQTGRQTDIQTDEREKAQADE